MRKGAILGASCFSITTYGSSSSNSYRDILDS
jgi:hypothetical protein